MECEKTFPHHISDKTLIPRKNMKKSYNPATKENQTGKAVLGVRGTRGDGQSAGAFQSHGIILGDTCHHPSQNPQSIQRQE